MERGTGEKKETLLDFGLIKDLPSAAIFSGKFFKDVKGQWSIHQGFSELPSSYPNLKNSLFAFVKKVEWIHSPFPNPSFKRGLWVYGRTVLKDLCPVTPAISTLPTEASQVQRGEKSCSLPDWNCSF